MRRYLLAAVIAASVVGVAAPAVAQSDVSVGDSVQVEAVFDETDDACGFADFNDTYVATAGEDARGRSVDLVQPSTGDSAQLRLNQDGEPVVEPAGTDETYSDAAIDPETGALSALYSYTDDGCTQVWLALFALPPGFFTFLAEDPARVAEDSAPPAEEEVVVTETDPAPPVEEEAVVTETDPAPPAEEEVAVAEEEVAVTNTSAGGDSGLSFFFWILIAAFVVAFGWGLFWFFFRRPQRLYRFDRGDAGVFIDEDDQKEIVIGGEELPTFGPIAESEVEQVFLPPRASDIEIDVPPSHHLCDVYHNEWRESVERLARLEAEADARVGTVDRQPERHQLMIEQARDSMNAYRAIYEDCLDANPESEPAAPGPGQPTDDNSGSSGQDGAGTDEGADTGDDTTDSGDEAGTGSPGILVPPSVTSEPNRDCEGEDFKVEDEKSFRVLAGNVTIQATLQSTFGGKGISGADLMELSQGDLEELFAGIESMGAENKISIKVPTQLLTITCTLTLVCSGGRWIETDRTNRVEKFSDPETKFFRQKSQEAKRSAVFVVDAVKAQVETLLDVQREADAFGCD